MDYREYKATYNALLSDKGRDELGSDTVKRDRLEAKIDKFLKFYPAVVPPDSNPDAPITDISLQQLTHRSLKTAVSIINEISDLMGKRETLSSTDFRRQMVRIFTTPERRMYVGVWLVFLSFILYFIDSSS